MSEIWKDIPEFPQYQVSNLGRVKSCQTMGPNKALSPEQEEAVRAEYAAGGITQTELATKYNVGIGTIRGLLKPGNAPVKGRILKPWVPGSGYLHVYLCNDEGRFNIAIHRLVAELFCTRAHPDQVYVNHKDGDRHNPRADNLEWCTPRENVLHAIETGLFDPAACARLRFDALKEAA